VQTAVTGWQVMSLPMLWPVVQTFRVASAGVQEMVARWGASAGELAETVAPAESLFSRQVSAVAVNAAHVDVAAFTAGLAARIGVRTTDVADVDAGYVAQEAASVTALATAAAPLISD
jgi:alkyl hydroperoxide reductase subunit AhpF